MRERETQGSVAAHGDPADGAAGAAGKNPVLAFDLRDEFLQEEVVIAHKAIGGVDVKAAAALRSDDQKVTHLVLVAQILEQGPAAAVEKRLFVVSQTAKKIEYRITLRGLLGGACIVARGQVDAKVDHLFQDVAV